MRENFFRRRGDSCRARHLEFVGLSGNHHEQQDANDDEGEEDRNHIVSFGWVSVQKFREVLTPTPE